MFAKKPSPNFGERPEGVKPSLLILHYTGMKTSCAALERLCDPKSEVSAHYLVCEEGSIVQMVAEDKRAWHAGKSYWRGIEDVNSHSIGVEIVNKGHEFGYEEFPEVQIETVIRLCQKIMQRHDIKPENVLGHSDIAPARKQDPGELFPWQKLAEKGVGVWPEPVAEGAREEGFKALLVEYGYDPSVDLETLTEAFHRHFYPENLGKSADKESAARLQSLIMQKKRSEDL